MTEEEIKAKEAEEQEAEETEETEEQETEKTEETESTLILNVKKGYEEKLAKQKDTYEKKLKERENVITQLLTGDDDANKSKPSIIDNINALRKAQNKW